MDSKFLYKIYLPSNLKEGEKYPVVYAMHGMGSDEDNIMDLTEEFRKDHIVIGIRGSITIQGGFTYFTIKGYGNPDRKSFDEAIGNLEEFIEKAAKEYPIDLNNQYLLGFSQGAILSMSLALVMGNKIKGIVALSGYIPKFVKEEYAIQSVDETAVYISHGEFDPIFPSNIGKENYEFFKEKSKNVSFMLYPQGHEVSVKNKNDMIKWLKNLNSDKDF